MFLRSKLPVEQRDKYITPPYFYKLLDEEFHFSNFDPCPIDWSSDTHPDGLTIPWEKCTFVNPPYSKARLWIKKAHEECLKGNTVVMLLNVITSTVAFHNYIWKRDNVEIRFVKGKLNFSRPGEPERKKGSNPRDNMVVIWRPMRPVEPEPDSGEESE